MRTRIGQLSAFLQLVFCYVIPYAIPGRLFSQEGGGTSEWVPLAQQSAIRLVRALAPTMTSKQLGLVLGEDDAHSLVRAPIFVLAQRSLPFLFFTFYNPAVCSTLGVSFFLVFVAIRRPYPLRVTLNKKKGPYDDAHTKDPCLCFMGGDSLNRGGRKKWSSRGLW